jgi:hypothetical protein
MIIFSEKGQTIIEAVVALATILLIIAAIAIVIVNALYNSQFIKSQNMANKYAQQGMEFVKNLAQNDLSSFAVYDSGTYCIDATVTPSALTSVCDTINASSPKRTIDFIRGSSECSTIETKVTVTVKWSSTRCPSSNTFCHKSELVSCMPYQVLLSNP